MSNTATRPVIGGPSGLVTYVDAAGLQYPAFVNYDFAAMSGSPNMGSVDLTYIDVNAQNFYPENDLVRPTKGRKPARANLVLDQGNIPASLTVPTALTAGSTAATVSSATGVPAAGFANGPGIPANTPYTLSGTTVTLGSAVLAGATNAAAPVTYSALAITTPYWRYPAVYVI